MRAAPRHPDLALRRELREGHLIRCANPECGALLTPRQVIEHRCLTHRELLEELAVGRRALDADSPFPARSVRGGR